MRLLGLLVIPALIVAAGLSAQARENHCDHSKGKARGTIIGGLLGAGAGALLGHGSTEGILIGGGAGALGGRVIGDGEDDRKDIEECGADAESYQRKMDREDDRDARAEARADRRDSEISRDRYSSRSRRSSQRYMCMNLGRGRFGLVHLRTNSVVETFGRDLRSCERAEDYRNGY